MSFINYFNTSEIDKSIFTFTNQVWMTKNTTCSCTTIPAEEQKQQQQKQTKKQREIQNPCSISTTILQIKL